MYYCLYNCRSEDNVLHLLDMCEVSKDILLKLLQHNLQVNVEISGNKYKIHCGISQK